MRGERAFVGPFGHRGSHRRRRRSPLHRGDTRSVTSEVPCSLRPVVLPLLLAFAATFLVGCGGGSSPVAPNPGPSAAPAPAPTPTPDPRVGLALGPVTRFTIKPRGSTEGSVPDPALDAQGRFHLTRGQRIDVDGTQKNSSNEICAWINPPVYLVNGQSMTFETSNGVVFRRGSSQPFLLKLTTENRGRSASRGRSTAWSPTSSSSRGVVRARRTPGGRSGSSSRRCPPAPRGAAAPSSAGPRRRGTRPAGSSR